MDRIVAALICLLLLGPAIARAEAPPITKIEARSLPTSELKRRVLRQLADVLVEAPRPQGRRRPTQPLSDLWFTTKARETSVDGLCEFDQVMVSFRPVAPTQGAETPVIATGITAQTRYHFRRLPTPSSLAREVRPGEGEADCRRLDVNDVAAIQARSPDDAADAVARLVLAERAAADGRPFPTTCEGGTIASEFCREPLKGVAEAEGFDVSDCPANAGGRDGCWRIENCGVDVRIWGAPGSPEAITRVEISLPICVADEKLD